MHIADIAFLATATPIWFGWGIWAAYQEYRLIILDKHTITRKEWAFLTLITFAGLATGYLGIIARQERKEKERIEQENKLRRK